MSSLLAILLLSTPLLAQDPAEEPVQQPMERFIPASARCFVHASDLQQLDQALRRTNVAGLVPLLDAAALQSDKFPDPRTALLQLIAQEQTIGKEDLIGREVAAVAPSWFQLEQAYWLLRVSDPALIDQWFPPERRSQEDETGAMRFFLVQENLVVAIRDDIVALGRRDAGNALLGETMALMADAGGATLEDSDSYKKLVETLPSSPVGLAYLARSEPHEQSMPHLSSWGADFELAAIGLHVQSDRLSVAIRTSPAHPDDQTTVSDYAVEQLLKLPRATLLALATTFEPNHLFEEEASRASANPLERALRALQRFAGDSQSEGGPFSTLGPNLIITWNPNLRGYGTVPQVAVLIECEDPAAVRNEVEAIAERILPILESVYQSEPHTGARIEYSRYFGTKIVQIPMRKHAAKSDYPLIKLLKRATPSFAAVDGWFVFAMSPEHIRKIIRCNNDLSRSWDAVPEIKEACQRYRNSSTLCIAQPGLASGIIERWLRDLDKGAPSLLDPKWWKPTEQSARDKLRRFGIGMKARQRPGVVVIARVYADTAADGRLQPGDRIVGVDGELLSMDRPNADLRRRLLASKTRSGPILRVLRDQALINVQLVVEEEKDSASRWTPAGILRGLARIGHYANIAVLAAEPDQEDSQSLHLVLQAAP